MYMLYPDSSNDCLMMCVVLCYGVTVTQNMVFLYFATSEIRTYVYKNFSAVG